MGKMLLKFIIHLIPYTQLGVCLLLNRATLKSFLSPSLSCFLLPSSYILSIFFVFSSWDRYGVAIIEIAISSLQLITILLFSYLTYSPNLSCPKHILPHVGFLMIKCLKSKWPWHFIQETSIEGLRCGKFYGTFWRYKDKWTQFLSYMHSLVGNTYLKNKMKHMLQ